MFRVHIIDVFRSIFTVRGKVPVSSVDGIIMSDSINLSMLAGKF